MRSKEHCFGAFLGSLQHSMLISPFLLIIIARQGLRVRLLVDGLGSRRLSRPMRERMLASGVDILSYQPFSHNRNHRKMTIIDSRIAHVGGVNIADRYVVGNNLGTWYDVQLRIENDRVAELAELFDYDCMLCSGLRVVAPQPSARQGVDYYWSECNGGCAMPQLLEDVIEGAEHSLTLISPYFMPPRRTLDMLSDAVARGVRITIIVPERCDIWALDDVMRHYVGRAQLRGIDMLITRSAFVHAKLALVDGCRTVLGSANLDSRSLYINRELMVSTTRRDVCQAAGHFIARLREISTPPLERELHSIIPSLITRLFEPVL